MLATDPQVSLDRVAAHAQVRPTTLYHHFPGRDALLDALTDRSISEVCWVLAIRPTDRGNLRRGDAAFAARSAWQVVGRYRGLLSINPRRLGRDELRRRLDPAVQPIRALIIRGQRNGEFDTTLPPDWLLGLVIDMIHAASAQVSAGTMDPRRPNRRCCAAPPRSSPATADPTPTPSALALALRETSVLQ